MTAGATPPRSHRRPGFSVLELLVAVAILTLVASGAVLAWAQVEAALQLDAAVHQVSGDLRAVHDLAVASAGSVRLVLQLGGDRYRRERAGDDGIYRLDRERALPTGIVVADVNSGGVLSFSARGQAENSTIVLADRRGVRRAVRLNQRGTITVLTAGA